MMKSVWLSAAILSASLAAQALAAAAPSASAPAQSVPASQPQVVNLADLFGATRAVIDLVETGQGEERLVKALASVDAIMARLGAVDQALPSDQSHWTWAPAEQIPLEDEPLQEKFLIDPPLENASAISFHVNDDRVRIESIKVIDAHGISTVFSIQRPYDEDMEQRAVRFMYYPTPVSTIIVTYAAEEDARKRLNVWAGVTDLPEYAKESLYYLALARRELRQGEVAKASEHLKKAARGMYLYRISRKIQ